MVGYSWAVEMDVVFKQRDRPKTPFNNNDVAVLMDSKTG